RLAHLIYEIPLLHECSYRFRQFVASLRFDDKTSFTVPNDFWQAAAGRTNDGTPKSARLEGRHAQRFLTTTGHDTHIQIAVKLSLITDIPAPAHLISDFQLQDFALETFDVMRIAVTEDAQQNRCRAARQQRNRS